MKKHKFLHSMILSPKELPERDFQWIFEYFLTSESQNGSMANVLSYRTNITLCMELTMYHMIYPNWPILFSKLIIFNKKDDFFGLLFTRNEVYIFTRFFFSVLRLVIATKMLVSIRIKLSDSFSDQRIGNQIWSIFLLIETVTKMLFRAIIDIISFRRRDSFNLFYDLWLCVT